MRSLGAYAAPLVTLPIAFIFIDPHQYGLYALYLAAVSAISPVSTLRLDLIYPAERDEERQAILRQLARNSVIFFSGIVVLAATVLYFVVGESTLEFYLGICIAAGVCAQGYGQVAQADAVLEQQPSKVISARLYFGLVLGILQPAAVAAAPRFESLIAVDLLARWVFLKALRGSLPAYGNSQRGLLIELKRSRSRVVAASIAAVVNGVSVQAPIFAAGVIYGPTVAGLVGASYKILSAPVRVVSQAIQPYFLSEYVRALRVRSLGLNRVVGKYLLFMLAIALPIYSSGAFLIRPAIDLLSDSWSDLPAYYLILTPLFAMSFIAIPISQALIPSGRHRQQVVWEFARLSGLALVIGIIALFKFEAAAGLALLVAVQVVAYFALIYLVTNLRLK